MSGKHITDQQIRLYMNTRNKGHTQLTAAAKAGFSERTARRIDHGDITTEGHSSRHWRTRKDPLADVWESELLPMLEQEPTLLPMTLFEHLCDQYPGHYDKRILRTLQRRIKTWKAQHGAAKEVMFRQVKVPGRQGLSDFTVLKDTTITIRGEVFDHRLYHYRLAFSGWRSVKVICGGESFTALSTGLQDALWRCGGVPQEHRTDSLSAAYNNLAEQEQLTQRYQGLCRHYGLKATRNNPGASHENGAIESPHGHLKRRLKQALLLRGNHHFESLAEYQGFIDQVVHKMNQQVSSRFQEELALLQPLPKRRTHDYAEHRVVVSTSSTFDLKRVTYTVPSRLIGEALTLHLYDDHLKVYHGHVFIQQVPRVYARKQQRGRCVNYRHVIDSLIRKPRAFRYSQLRDDLLPSADYQRIWQYVDQHLSADNACRYIVRLLHLAATNDCEAALGRYVLSGIEQDQLPGEHQCRQHFSDEKTVIPLIPSHQHALGDYDQLLGNPPVVILPEVQHG